MIMRSQRWIEFLFPSSCLACGKASCDVLCQRCCTALPWLDASDSCRVGQGPIKKTLAPVSFSGRVREWILQFKYPPPGILGIDSQPTGIVLMLARAAANLADTEGATCVIPVPCHRYRFRKRGFDPSYRLALEIARHARLRFEPNLLIRNRDTLPQTGLNAHLRVTNVKGAFVARMASKGRVWLVDDVVTTGATLESAAGALKQAGIGDVVGVCLARTMFEGSARL